MTIRPATAADAEGIWQIFKAVVAGGDTYVFAPDTPRPVALDYYLGANIRSWVAEAESRVGGVYKLIPNRRDLGSHVANASFMVAPSAHGRGIGRAMGPERGQARRLPGDAAQLRREHEQGRRPSLGKSSGSRFSRHSPRRSSTPPSATSRT